MGLNDRKIATCAYLLGKSPGTIERNHQKLLALGLSDEKIASQASLLGRDPNSIGRYYQILRDLGLSNTKIASQAQLLSMNPETIVRNYQALQRLGLSDEKIASQASLLGSNPKTIERNYRHLISLLRDNYLDRNSGRRIVHMCTSLLSRSPSTIESTIQYLSNHDLDYRRQPLLFSSNPKTKRKKLVWILREVFDYRVLEKDEKKQAIQSAYSLVRDDPQLFIDSIKTLEKKRDKLREKAALYR